MIRIAFLLSWVGLFMACNNDPGYKIYVSDIDPLTWDSCNLKEFVVEDFNINMLPYEELPYVNGRITSKDVLTRKRIYDQDSIPMIERPKQPGQLYYHPTNMIIYSLEVFDQLVVTQKDTASLATVQKVAQKLVEESTRLDSSLLLTYKFDFPIHDRRSGEVMKSPWYSSMAQGMMLSLMMRLYEYTGDSTYMELADSCFNAYRKIKGRGAQPWFSCIDSNKNIWFEEYPTELPAFTLNGKIFAILGLYDYYRVTQKAEVKRYLQGGITTIKNNIERYRVENECSNYCLKHIFCDVQICIYHEVHIGQLRLLHAITGDPYFKQMANTFEADTLVVM